MVANLSYIRSMSLRRKEKHPEWVLSRMVPGACGRRRSSVLLRLHDHVVDHVYAHIGNLVVAVFLDEYESDVAEALLFSTRQLIASGHKTLVRNSEIAHIAALLEAAKGAGTVDPGTDAEAVAEYLLSSALGVAAYALTIASDESYLAAAQRLFPRIFSAVTGTPVFVKA